MNSALAKPTKDHAPDHAPPNLAKAPTRKRKVAGGGHKREPIRSEGNSTVLLGFVRERAYVLVHANFCMPMNRHIKFKGGNEFKGGDFLEN